MAVSSLDYLFSNGRMVGCFVYMLLCRDDESIHIKIGMSQDPLKRALAVRGCSPLTIESMALVDLPSRDMAAAMEHSFHRAFAKWRTNGEWFKFSNSDKPEFNVIQQGVLREYESASRQLKWTKLNVNELAKQATARKNMVRRRWKTNGRAYRDAVSAGLR